MRQIRDVIEFAKEFERMCSEYPHCELECPFNRDCPNLKTITEEHVNVLSKWVDKHPAPTYVVVTTYRIPDETDGASTSVVAATADINEARRIFSNEVASLQAHFKDCDCSEGSIDKHESWKSEDAGSYYFTVEIKKV